MGDLIRSVTDASNSVTKLHNFLSSKHTKATSVFNLYLIYLGKNNLC